MELWWMITWSYYGWSYIVGMSYYGVGLSLFCARIYYILLKCHILVLELIIYYWNLLFWCFLVEGMSKNCWNVLFMCYLYLSIDKCYQTHWKNLSLGCMKRDRHGRVAQATKHTLSVLELDLLIFFIVRQVSIYRPIQFVCPPTQFGALCSWHIQHNSGPGPEN